MLGKNLSSAELAAEAEHEGVRQISDKAVRMSVLIWMKNMTNLGSKQQNTSPNIMQSLVPS